MGTSSAQARHIGRQLRYRLRASASISRRPTVDQFKVGRRKRGFDRREEDLRGSEAKRSAKASITPAPPSVASVIQTLAALQSGSS